MKLASSPKRARKVWRTASAAALFGLLAMAAAAQQQRANERAPAQVPKATVAAKPAAAAASAASANLTASTPTTPATATSAPAAALVGAAAASAPAASERADRAELDRTQIIGNRELPKVLYIVPWKKPISGAMERPVKSVIDEVFAPVDREVLRRQVRYEAQVRTAGEAAMEAASTPTPPPK